MSKIQRTKHRVTEVLQVHVDVNIPASGQLTRPASNFIESDGYEKIAILTRSDTSASNTVQIMWSMDSIGGNETWETVNSSISGTNKIGFTDVKAPYFKVVVYNNDGASAHVTNTWAYLR